MTAQTPHLYSMRASYRRCLLIDATCLPDSAFFVPRFRF